LHLHHPLAIPFETLDALCGRPILLDPESLQKKLIAERRGGYCFEQNLLFGEVLATLGFQVVRLAARVLWESRDSVRARTHMLLFVQLGEGGYLCDVGFGGLTLTAPLRLEPEVDQTTPHEVFRVVRRGNEFALEANLRGERKTLYGFDLQEQLQIDIEVLNHFVATHPASPFLSGLMAARTGMDRRCGLRDRWLTVHHANGSSERRELQSAQELRRVLVGTFGINVPEGRDVDTALGRLFV
jgi:N-hydroxyarylamine O-acetyltransferase